MKPTVKIKRTRNPGGNITDLVDIFVFPNKQMIGFQREEKKNKITDGREVNKKLKIFA